MKNDFTKARRNLVILYLCIIGSVIVLFSCLVVYQANDSFSDPAIVTDEEIRISAKEALEIAREAQGKKEIAETEYEIEKGKLYFTIAFKDESEVKIDLFTGELHFPQAKSFRTELTDDFDERVGWIGLIVFFAAGILALYVANRTLKPISLSIRKQKQFIAGAAHELRNPLAALHARIESLLRSHQESVSKSELTDLLSETKHLIGISESLLTLEKSEAKKSHPEMLALGDVLTSEIERLEHTLKDKQISLNTDLGNGKVQIDKYELHTVVYNLLHNAIKFTPPLGTITVSWKEGALTIMDSGIGIPIESIPHIFERFYKVDPAQSKEGNGLGLSIVKEILERNNATIRVLSQVGMGTTFTVFFGRTT